MDPYRRVHLNLFTQILTINCAHTPLPPRTHTHTHTHTHTSPLPITPLGARVSPKSYWLETGRGEARQAWNRYALIPSRANANPYAHPCPREYLPPLYTHLSSRCYLSLKRASSASSPLPPPPPLHPSVPTPLPPYSPTPYPLLP